MVADATRASAITTEVPRLTDSRRSAPSAREGCFLFHKGSPMAGARLSDDDPIQPLMSWGLGSAVERKGDTRPLDEIHPQTLEFFLAARSQ